MKLLTKELRSKLPEYGSQAFKEPEDITIIVKFFCPWNQWTWYAYEFDGEDTFFGYVKGDFNELGTFSLSELENVRGPLGLHIERDMYYKPQTLAEVMSKCATA